MEELAVIFMTIQIIFLQAESVASLFNMRNKAVQMGMGGDDERTRSERVHGGRVHAGRVHARRVHDV